MIGIPMRHSLAAGCLFLAWAVIPPNAANATCGEECDQQYSSDVDDCHSNFGDDPADAEDLARCIRDARDDYGSCVNNCARQMLLSFLARTSANIQCEAVQQLSDVVGVAAPGVCDETMKWRSLPARQERFSAKAGVGR
jgi:hypothetical protein